LHKDHLKKTAKILTSSLHAGKFARAVLDQPKSDRQRRKSSAVIFLKASPRITAAGAIGRRNKKLKPQGLRSRDRAGRIRVGA
jgi:hypothetical protein